MAQQRSSVAHSNRNKPAPEGRRQREIFAARTVEAERKVVSKEQASDKGTNKARANRKSLRVVKTSSNYCVKSSG